MRRFLIAWLIFAALPVFGQVKTHLVPKFSVPSEKAELLFHQVLDENGPTLAMKILEHNQPSMTNIFKWDPKTPRRQVASITITLTTHDDPDVEQQLEQSTLVGENQLEKKTLTILWSPRDPVTKKIDRSVEHIEVYVFLDRIFFDKAGNRLEQGFSHFISVLGHEIFGNVTDFLTLKADQDINSYQARVRREVHAFQQGVEFLNRTITHLESLNFSQDDINALKSNREEQKTALAEWKKLLK
jgi:hypothetical protein